MPYKPKKPCAYPGCAELTHERYCEKHKPIVNKQYNQFERDKQSQAFYESVAWRRLKRLPFTVLFVDGNHENFDILDNMPIEVWKGGNAHRVADNIIHLMRGQIFTIEGKTFFTFGGAESVDKDTRTAGVTWWSQEIPTHQDYAEAYKNLAKYDNRVDYIITHTIDESALYCPQMQRFLESKGLTETNRGLSGFEKAVDYKHWFFGHYHIEAVIPLPKGERGPSKKTAVFNRVIEITDGGLL